MRFLTRLIVNGVALMIAAWFIPGLVVEGPAAALIAGIILGFVNAVIRPVLFFLTLPLTLLTLGLFLFVLNAICLGITAWLVPGVDILDWLSAVLAALVVTVVSWILNGLLAGTREKARD